MQPERHRTLSLVAGTAARCALAFACGALAAPALALGLGSGPPAVVIGAPLDYAVPIRLDGDESLTAECVQADVVFGERAVPASVRLRQGAGNTLVLRISTTAVIDEPVVSIAVAAGCGSRISRRYTVLADPGQPAVAATPAPPPPAAMLAPSALPSSEVVTAGAVPQPAGPSVAADDAAEARRRAARQAAAARASAAPAPAPARVDRGPSAAAPDPAEAASRRAARAAERAAARAAARAARAAKAERPVPVAVPKARLTLEPAESELAPRSPGAVEEALAAVAEAASQARASAEAASAAAQRIAELERNVAQARAEARASQSEATQLRSRVSQTQELPWWSWALFAFSVGMALAAAWMAWRMRGMQQAQEIAWARASALSGSSSAQAAAEVDAPAAPGRETSPLPLVTSELTQPAPLAVSPGARPATRPSQPTAPPPPVPRRDVELPSERTLVLPPSVRVDEAAPRDVSIEELIDVDQQAEFFLAIGQDHAAIELLVAHLRNTGGGSPLTYLKLLDIYRRLGMHEDYERTRSRFNHRFNAYAPEWGADLQGGRSLEDYEGVLPRLQAAWSRPLDAMAELEALLFRKSRGELFDLSAYREVLFLYALARDLLDRDGNAGDRDDVDLLLPLSPGHAPVDLLVGDARATTDVPLDDHPTAPLDLDLTPHVSPPSIFSEPPPTMRVPRRS